jgi:hypothetical protein
MILANAKHHRNDPRCYAPAIHPLIVDMNVYDFLYSIQHDPLSGLFVNEDTQVAKGAPCQRGPVS